MKKFEKIISDLEKEGFTFTTFDHEGMGMDFVIHNRSNGKFYFVKLTPGKAAALNDERILELIDFMKAKVQG